MNRIGKYDIVGKLGKGGMGIVYRAFDRVLEREVALKTQRIDDSSGDESVERFFREARLIASLQHRNIVTVHDLGQDADTVYIVMEVLKGEDLHRILQSGKHVALEEKVRYVREVAEGLAHAHRKGIVHRDIKPRNVFVTDEGEVKLLDFGLAHIAQSTLTKAGQVLGTPHYMSPEQVLGQAPDPRSDIFSLGALFYELLTGEKAFGAPNLQQVLDAIMGRDPKPIRELSAAMPQELSRIVAKMLSKSLDGRYPSVEVLLRDLARFKRFLTQCKVQLRDEIQRKVGELRELAHQHRERLAERGVEPSTKRLADTAERDDLTYMALVGLRDGANVELSRLGSIARAAVAERAAARGPTAGAGAGTGDGDGQETLTLPGSEIDLERATERRRREKKAAKAFDEAQARFAEGDLAGSLVLVSDALRWSPTHEPAAELAERLRSSIVERVDRWEAKEGSQQMDVLVAALLAMDDGKKDEPPLAPKPPSSGTSSDMIASLSEVFLASLPDVDDANGKNDADSEGAPTRRHDETGS